MDKKQFSISYSILQHVLRNGIFYLKGGDLEEELKEYRAVQIFELTDYFEEAFFETKKVVYLPQKFKG